MASSGMPARRLRRIAAGGSASCATAATAARMRSRSALREGRGASAGEPLEQRLEGRPRVTDEPDRLRVVPADLLGVDVDLDHLLRRLERGDGQARADGEDHVRRVEIARAAGCPSRAPPPARGRWRR